MSKNPAKKKSLQDDPKIVDQQIEPCLRALQKKLRNINKKLTEIEDLETKPHLKPEQEEKVSRKQEVLYEREKYQELTELYRGVLKDNQKAIRKSQLVELEDLAALIASREYGADVGEKSNATIDNLVKVLTSSSAANMTLKNRVSQISEALTKVADDKRLKSSIRRYLEENQDKTAVVESMSIEPEPRSPRSEKEREKQIEEIEEELAEKQHEIDQANEAEAAVSQAPATTHSHDKPPSVQPEIERTQSAPHDDVAAEKEPKDAEKPQGQKLGEAKPEEKPAREQKRNEGDRRGRGRGRGRGGRREGNDDREGKPAYRKKYEPKDKAENERRRSSSSSSSSLEGTPEPRQFKRQEVRELIEDGFIVVGKPKLKAQGKEQKEFHNHEHGKKFHPHHQKRNF